MKSKREYNEEYVYKESYIIIDEIPRITCTKERDVIIIIRGIIVY